MNINTIVILVAMGIEAKCIAHELELIEYSHPLLDEDLPVKIFHKKILNKDVYLVQSGKCKKYGLDRIGTQPATLLAWEAINRLKPDILINAGTAGGFFAKGAKIGDVYFCEEFKYHHRLMKPAEEYIPYGIAGYKSADLSCFINGLDIKTGIISTGDSIFGSKEEMQQLSENQADLKDMEACAIAEVAFIKHVPFVALKSVSDLVDTTESTVVQFQKNYKLAMQNLSKKLVPFIVKLISTETNSFSKI